MLIVIFQADAQDHQLTGGKGATRYTFRNYSRRGSMVQTQRELSVPTSPTPSHTPESNVDLRRLVSEARAGESLSGALHQGEKDA